MHINTLFNFQSDHSFLRLATGACNTFSHPTPVRVVSDASVPKDSDHDLSERFEALTSDLSLRARDGRGALVFFFL